jgi:hypothetical protein
MNLNRQTTMTEALNSEVKQPAPSGRLLPLVGPWNNPDETTPIPRRTSHWSAVAATQLCEALSCRSDTPSEFVRHLEAACDALRRAADYLHEDWPNAEHSNSHPDKIS